MFCSVQEPYFLIFANLQSNKRLKKETLRFSHWFFAYMHFSKPEVFQSYQKSLGENQGKPEVVYLPPEKKKKKKPVCLFEFWGRPFKLAKFHLNRCDGM